MKEKIKEFVLGMGVDDVGFAKATDYISPRSPELVSMFPKVQSIIVLAYKELSACESPNMQIAMGGRLDVMEFSRSCSYKLARFIEKELHGKAMTISLSYPMDMSLKTGGTIADVSLRHAAVAAGLGAFGRHNLVIHPKLGTRVVFTAVLTDLELPSDPPITDDLCIDCNICVESCPARALDVEGKTHVGRCLKVSQPYGLGADIAFRTKLVGSSPEEQKAMFLDDHYWKLYQTGFIGFQYFCFECYKSCPIGQ